MDIQVIIDNLRVNPYKKLSESRRVKLDGNIAATLGNASYETISILSAVIKAISSKMFIEEVVTNDTLEFPVPIDQRETFYKASRDGCVYFLVSFDNVAQKASYAVLEAFDGVRGASYVEDEDGNVLFGVNTWIVKQNRFKTQKESVRYVDLYFDNRVEKYKEDGHVYIRRETIDDNGNSDAGITWLTDNGTSDGIALGMPLLKVSIEQSDVANGAIQIQEFINSTILDMLAVSRTQGFPQRFITGSDRFAGQLTNANGQPLIDNFGTPIRRDFEATPGSILRLDGSNLQLGQLEPTEADTTVIDKLLHMLEIITTVPTHYFTGQWPSGVALIQSEQRLNQKCEAHEDAMEPDLLDIFRYGYMLELFYRDGIALETAYETAVNSIVGMKWYTLEVETLELRMEQESARINNASALVTAGILSIEDALKYIYPDKDEAEIQAMAARAKAGGDITTF